MRFAVLLYQDEAVWDNATEAEQALYMSQHDAFSRAVTDRGLTMGPAEALTSVAAATTVRRRGERCEITDGPFAETTEQFGGFYIVDAPDIDVLIEIVQLLPEYTIEIRPIADMSDMTDLPAETSAGSMQ